MWCAAGDVAAGLIATLGAFTSRYGGGRPYLNRAIQLAVIAVSLAAAVALGVWAAQVPCVGVLTVSAIGVAAVLLCDALAVGPPGAYIFVVACAAGIGIGCAPGPLADWPARVGRRCRCLGGADGGRADGLSTARKGRGLRSW